MSMLEMQRLACGAFEWFQQALMCLSLVMMGMLLAVLACRSRTVRDAAARVRSLWQGASPMSRLVSLTLVCGMAMYAGTKTNSPPRLNAPLPRSLQQTPGQLISQEEIAQGYRLERVTTNAAASYSIPTNGVQYAPWSLRGGRETHFPLDLGDFAFPFGTGVVRRLDVLSGGTVESLPWRRPEGEPPQCLASTMSICAAREWASVVPGVSGFWWADEALPGCRGAKLMTWVDVFAGRDRTGQYSAQIEMHGDGNFVTRSNNVERTYRRVFPSDLDFDGLPNSIDPDPETPLATSAWNQSEAWAAAAFPSNADEIASAGGYAAWTGVRASDPDRRLISLGVAFDDGSAWPALLEFGDVPVMADGNAEVAFALDCGAKVPFTLTAGRLASAAVTVTAPPVRSGGGGSTTYNGVFSNVFSYPHERSVGDVTVHLDDPRTGWILRIAEVSLVSDRLPHMFPGDSVQVSAQLSNCHSNAYLGCTWSGGGSGISFSDPHSLSTTVTYDSASSVEWATNGIDLVTRFFGYSLTNHVIFTEGINEEPQLGFSIGCQEVFFLNDADFLEGECPSNRPERIRPVTLDLIGPLGTNGTVRLSVQGSAEPVVFQIVDGVTNQVNSSTEISLAVSDDFAHTESCTVYVSCPKLGTGTITATFTPAGGGAPLTDSATFRCIEPLRKLVTTEKSGGRFVNPSRLVMGTNAVLKVGANGAFSPSEVQWRVVSGPGRVSSTNGWETTVTPTGLGTVTVEARFNDDEIQPRFVLPVVQPRTIPVKAFVVEPPREQKAAAWKDGDIIGHITSANMIFSQIGVQFQLSSIVHGVGNSNDWDLCIYEERNYDTKWETLSIEEYTDQFMQLVNVYTNRNCVKIFYVGTVKQSSESQTEDLVALWKSEGIFIPKGMPMESLAHELGHALGLFDIYLTNWYDATQPPVRQVTLAESCFQLEKRFFGEPDCDWGNETGRGFYELNDTLDSTIKKFLMYGVYEDINNIGYDIPSDTVWGLPALARSQEDARLVKIGARETESKESEVYSR